MASERSIIDMSAIDFDIGLKFNRNSSVFRHLKCNRVSIDSEQRIRMYILTKKKNYIRVVLKAIKSDTQFIPLDIQLS